MGQRYKLSFRLTVIGYYHNEGGKNAAKTARHFGIHRNTVYKWLKQFDPNNLHSLEPNPRAPIHRYRRKTAQEIINRIVEWKKKYPYYGKEKIRVILEREDGIKIIFPCAVFY